jgi:LacI family transcriptional regulator
MEQIAQEAGVSKMTVSRILRAQSVPVYSKAKERAKQVLGIAERLNYRPNAAAKAVVSGKFHCVTLLLSPEGDEDSEMCPLLPGILDGICVGLSERDYHLNVAHLSNAKAVGVALPKFLRENMSDGLLMNYYNEIPSRQMELIEQYKIPSIYINMKRPSDCVFPDDFGAARLATDRLIELGHRRILYLRNFPQPHYSATDRREGYLAGMKARGLKPLVVEIDSLSDSQQERLDPIFSRAGRPTAVLGYVNHASAFMLSVAARHGLKIPRDLSLMHFGEDCMIAGVNMGVISLPWFQVGRLAAQELLAKIEDPARQFPPQAILVPKIENFTTVAPPGGK